MTWPMDSRKGYFKERSRQFNGPQCKAPCLCGIATWMSWRVLPMPLRDAMPTPKPKKLTGVGNEGHNKQAC